ncbi:MAG: 5'-deoxynucleotidase [Ruminococcaceae bacterium]|nr:5'-deoxynucleotidase [Oscillospiraceae bacterium]
MQSHYYAILSRMKNINRWGLMRNTRNENLSEHSLEVALIAHALALIGEKRLGKNTKPDKIAVAAMFHDTSEIITGDMPTPIKYYNPEIKDAYKKIEAVAEEQLISMLPEDFRDDFREIYSPDSEITAYVKAADKISALIKCIEEIKMGNMEFKDAEASTRKTIESLDMPEVEIFMNEFIDSYYLTLDEQRSI